MLVFLPLLPLSLLNANFKNQSGFRNNTRQEKTKKQKHLKSLHMFNFTPCERGRASGSSIKAYGTIGSFLMAVLDMLTSPDIWKS